MSLLQRLGEQLRRYRPYAIAVVAVLLIVATSPTRGRTAVRQQAQAAAPPAGTGEPQAGATTITAPVALSPSAAAQPSGSAVSTTTPQTATGAPARAAAAGAAPVGGAVAAAHAVSFPGVGTPEALANPRCDAARGRMRFPDPYAPPCVVPWPAGADNGGATSQGIDAKTIRVVVYEQQQSTYGTQQDYEQLWKDYFDGVNRTFELWGRQFKLSFFYASGTDEVSQRADAIQIASSIKPFYVTTAATAPEVFDREMAARGTIVMGTFGIPWLSAQKQAPYRWSFSPDDHAVVLPVLEYAGKRLAPHPTKWAGDATMNGKPRVFAIVQPTTWDNGYLTAEASRQHVTFADQLTYDEGDTAGAQERARTVIAKLKTDGVTTIIDGAALVFNIALTKEATAQLYFPEWVTTGYSFQDTVIFSRLFDQQQWGHAFGVGTLGPTPPTDKITYYTDYVWFTGHAPYSNTHASFAWPDTILPAVAVTLAGPHLTPETYRNALFSFPPAGGSWCNCRAQVGTSFGRHIPQMPWDDYSGWEDVTEKWWDPTYRTNDELGLPGTGAWMKVDGGKRYLPGQQPATEPHVFDRNGTVESFPDWPQGEAPPSYPPPPR